jgi:hypothetical protein
MLGAETWHRILNAIERLQAQKPAEGRRSARWPRHDFQPGDSVDLVY